ncbi:MAG TPA: hypothetical protein VJU16_05180 [Planctomycetota bacterium]|nr:hypothetical protein [Planctomycetota bacterium]
MNTLCMAFLLLALPPQDSLDSKISTLLKRLNSEEIEQREAAAKDLIALAEPAIEPLEKAAGESGDPETVARLKAVVAQIRRNALIVKVAPPVRPVTVSAKDVPLRDFLKDVCGQAGIDFACDAAIGDRTVTLEAKGEPVLQVVDRACAARGDLVPTVAEGRLRVAAGKFAGDAAAYAQGYRLRVRRTVLTETVEAGTTKTSVALYFDLDSQPDQKVRVTTMTLPRSATAPDGGEIAVKGVLGSAMAMGGWMPAGMGAMVVDGVAVMIEPNDALDRICIIKEAPPGLKKLDSLKVSARFRYSVGNKSILVPLSMRNYDKIPDIPFSVHFNGRQLYFMSPDQGRSGAAALEDFVEVDTMVLIGKDGKESKVAPMRTGSRVQQMFQTESVTLQATDSPQLRMQVLDAVDRDVEFELKDIRLRD